MIILWYDNNMRRISRSFNNIHFSKYSHPLYSTLLCKAEPCFHLINTKKKHSLLYPYWDNSSLSVILQCSGPSNYLQEIQASQQLIFMATKTIMTVCSCHVTYVFQSESIHYSCLNVKELLAGSRHKIWGLSDCNSTRTQNLLVRKWTLNHFGQMVEYLFTN